MPETYTHTRFGQQAAKLLPEDIRKSVQRFRQLYDVGLHGPDLFFFYQPLYYTKRGALGGVYHAMTGREFFEKAVEHLQEAPSEGAEVYLYGVLCHYALDSVCHPFIRTASADGKLGHTEIETEFERWLLTKDGKTPAHRQNVGKKLRLTWGGCVTVSGFYPPSSAYSIRRCLRNMAVICWAKTINSRSLLHGILRLGGPSAAQMVMYTRPNHRCSHLNEQLEELFGQALELYPVLAAQLKEHIAHGTPLGEEFEVSFG